MGLDWIKMLASIAFGWQGNLSWVAGARFILPGSSRAWENAVILNEESVS
jgi:hypothetical protein